MFGCLFLLIGAGLLIAIFFLYEILLVIVTVIGLPLAALSPLGSWFRYKFEQMFALLIVTSFFGRMAAVLIISWGTQVAVHMPGLDNAFGEVLSLLVTLAFAIYTQWWLLKKADKIYGNVTNRSLGVQKVTGRVESMFRSSERRTSDQAQIQTAHINSLSPALVSNPISRLRFSGSTSVNTFTRPVSAPVASSLSRSRRAWNSIRKTNS
jgi:hypothetical protein